jgi:hypothetical protein
VSARYGLKTASDNKDGFLICETKKMIGWLLRHGICARACYLQSNAFHPVQHLPSQTVRMRVEEEDAAKNQAEARRQTDVKTVIIEITAAQERAFAQALEDYTEMRYATGLAFSWGPCLENALRWWRAQQLSIPLTCLLSLSCSSAVWRLKSWRPYPCLRQWRRRRKPASSL